jgi:hypothetical protein
MDARPNTDAGRFAEEGYCVVRGMVAAEALPRLRSDVFDCIDATKAGEAYARSQIGR